MTGLCHLRNCSDSLAFTLASYLNTQESLTDILQASMSADTSPQKSKKGTGGVELYHSLFNLFQLVLYLICRYNTPISRSLSIASSLAISPSFYLAWHVVFQPMYQLMFPSSLMCVHACVHVYTSYVFPVDNSLCRAILILASRSPAR